MTLFNGRSKIKHDPLIKKVHHQIHTRQNQIQRQHQDVMPLKYLVLLFGWLAAHGTCFTEAHEKIFPQSLDGFSTPTSSSNSLAEILAFEPLQFSILGIIVFCSSEPELS